MNRLVSSGRAGLRVARASGSLVPAYCRHELSRPHDSLRRPRRLNARRSSFRQDAETSEPEARATRSHGLWRAGGRCLAGLLLFTASLAARAAGQPNFLFLLADDMRPDAIGALGHSVVQTPNLDALVRDGAIFPRAVTGYPICHVSRAEMLTGCCAFRTGVEYRGTRIDSTLALWPETLRLAGYRTFFSGKWHNDGQPKERGFNETRGLFTAGGGGLIKPQPDHAGRPATGYTGWTFKTDDGRVEIEKGVGLTPDTDQQIADGAIALLREKRDAPFFAWVSFTGPHDPRIWPRGEEHLYFPEKIPLPKNFAPQHPFDHGNAGGRDEILLKLPRDPDEVRAELAVYYAVISNLDAQVGRIIAALRETGQWENTVIIFSSDHGLALGSHGLTGKQNMYEHTIGVPFILCGPGIPRGKRIAAQCYLRDLFPTTCELAGVPIPATVQARSLVPVLTEKASEIYREVFGCFTDTQRMIRDERWKLIWYPKISRSQLFDLTSDPDELHDLAANPEREVQLRSLRQKLDLWRKENGDPLLAAP